MDFDSISIETKKEEGTKDVWIEASLEDEVVGRLRFERTGTTTIIKFITVHPGYTRLGIGRWLVGLFTSDSDRVIAKGVRYQARGFWIRLGFLREEKNYCWTRDARISHLEGLEV